MVCFCIRACLSVVSVVCSLGYFRRFWVFVVYGLVEFAMQLGEVCKRGGGYSRCRSEVRCSVVNRVVGLGDEVRGSVKW